MAAVHLEAGSALANQVQAVLQSKLMEVGWVAEESDQTLSEYIVMMLVQGKDQAGVQAEIGNELLGMGDEDETVKRFAHWLFETVHSLVAPPPAMMATGVVADQRLGEQATRPETQQAPIQTHPEMPTADSQMQVDESSTAPVDGAPSGPKAMRAGRGRGGRMLGQMNRSMDRSLDAADPLRRIKGAASGHAGRISSHAARDQPPRGPRGSSAANGVQRMLNGGRGNHTLGAMGAPMMPNQDPMGSFDPQQRVLLMQMMRMQADFMTTMMQNGGPPQHQQPHASSMKARGLAERMDKPLRGDTRDVRFARGGRPPQSQAANSNAETDTSMDMDTSADGDAKSPNFTPFNTLCRFNLACTSPACKFAHQSPAAPSGTVVDLTDTCPYGSACTNHKCTGRHPSPAQRQQYQKSEVECKFYPNCLAGPMCPFKHPSAPPCRNGPDCSIEGCTFSHSKIICRYNPCLNPTCQYRHAEGQKRGKFEDRVWTKDKTGQQNGGEGKSDRFAELKAQEGQPEELIMPGSTSPPRAGEQLHHERNEQIQHNEHEQLAAPAESATPSPAPSASFSPGDGGFVSGVST